MSISTLRSSKFEAGAANAIAAAEWGTLLLLALLLLSLLLPKKSTAKLPPFGCVRLLVLLLQLLLPPEDRSMADASFKATSSRMVYKSWPLTRSSKAPVRPRHVKAISVPRSQQAVASLLPLLLPVLLVVLSLESAEPSSTPPPKPNVVAAKIRRLWCGGMSQLAIIADCKCLGFTDMASFNSKVRS